MWELINVYQTTQQRGIFFQSNLPWLQQMF